MPPPLRFTNKCDRCGQRYPRKHENCPHCKDLTETQLEELKLRVAEQHKANARLGTLFFLLAGFLLIGLLILL